MTQAVNATPQREEWQGSGEDERAAATRDNKWIGQSVTRLEDPPLVRGRGRFAADISFPHQLHMRIVRANHAHGKIVAIDTAAARALPGVIAVWTAADIADVPPIDFREGRIPALEPYRQPVLASDKVRYVGEPVAAVFADDPYVAEDAADLVSVEIEELPVLLAADAEPGDLSPGRNTEVSIIRQGYGDVDAVLSSAPIIVELELAMGRHSGVPLEGRGAIGRYDAARGILELHGAAKVPHRNRELLARMLKLPPASIHVHEAHVGGGFGIRGELYPEDVLVCVAAVRPRRPVEWIEDRRAFDRRQSFASAASPIARGRRRRRANPRHRRLLFPRSGRLCAHPCRARRAYDGRHPPRSLPGAGLSRGRPLSAHQQDSGGNVPRARSL
jgi:aerobic carbon-monoxide dehydrogenase large subunit